MAGIDRRAVELDRDNEEKKGRGERKREIQSKRARIYVYIEYARDAGKWERDHERGLDIRAT